MYQAFLFSILYLIYYITDKIQRHLEDTGVLQPSSKTKPDIPIVAVQTPSSTVNPRKQTKFETASNQNSSNNNIAQTSLVNEGQYLEDVTQNEP